MPSAKSQATQLLCVDNLRHTEYYGMQEVLDELYAGSQKGEVFSSLMEKILSRENILLAYRNIKTNTGSNTPGTDKLTIKDIGRLSPDEVVSKVRFIVTGSCHGYRPKPVRRKDIPKPYDPTKTRPLGIPCIWDRLIQQCIKQIMEPICEVKFSGSSHGFRPNRSAENAIAEASRRVQCSHLYYVIEFDIKGFFDNVNHSKLIKQIWAMGIQDKQLIWVLKRILKAPIKMPGGEMVFPDKGTPQGGIISPLLANIVLNELDHWVESQWREHPLTEKFYGYVNKKGTKVLAGAYEEMRRTRLKEMHIVRYADDFRIFCRTKAEAERTKIAVTQWLWERLKLEASPEKTRVVNVKRRYSEFLGIRLKAFPKGQKFVVKSRMSVNAQKRAKLKLVKQAKRIASPAKGHTEEFEVMFYNSQVAGLQNYYRIATGIGTDVSSINRAVMTVFTCRLKTPSRAKGARLVKSGRSLTPFERERYGKSKCLRYIAGSGEPIYPISYVRHKSPKEKKKSICSYTAEGRKGLHDNLRVNTSLMRALMFQPLHNRSAEYADNRISLFSAQWGKCAVTGREFQVASDVHCHHKLPRSNGGNDKYGNLILVLPPVHRLIHATDQQTVAAYLNLLHLDREQLAKLNKLRDLVGNNPISL